MPLTVDAHLDTLWVLSGLAVQKKPTVTKERMQFGGLDKGVFVLYLADWVLDRHDQGDINRLIGKAIFHAKEHFPEHYIALEGARCLGVMNPDELLVNLATAGIKYLTLVHNKNNIFCTSATDSGQICGITRFGQKLIRTCEDHGVLVDVSHASDKATGDVLNYTRKPIIASHSGCRAILGHPRNLTDEQIKQIALTGGMVGVPFAKKFVGTIPGIAAHIDHVCQLTGSVDHVGIGSDLDGAGMVEGVSGAEDWGTVVMQQLANRGFSDVAIGNIAGGNLLELFGEGQ